MSTLKLSFSGTIEVTDGLLAAYGVSTAHQLAAAMIADHMSEESDPYFLFDALEGLQLDVEVKP